MPNIKHLYNFFHICSFYSTALKKWKSLISKYSALSQDLLLFLTTAGSTGYAFEDDCPSFNVLKFWKHTCSITFVYNLYSSPENTSGTSADTPRVGFSPGEKKFLWPQQGQTG
jgi:hypothetical protein